MSGHGVEQAGKKKDRELSADSLVDLRIAESVDGPAQCKTDLSV